MLLKNLEGKKHYSMRLNLNEPLSWSISNRKVYHWQYFITLAWQRLLLKMPSHVFNGLQQSHEQILSAQDCPASHSHPDVEFDVLVGDGFDVEADGGNGVDGLAQLELVQDGRFAGGVKTQHQDPHLLVAEH